MVNNLLVKNVSNKVLRIKILSEELKIGMKPIYYKNHSKTRNRVKKAKLLYFASHYNMKTGYFLVATACLFSLIRALLPLLSRK